MAVRVKDIFVIALTYVLLTFEQMICHQMSRHAKHHNLHSNSNSSHAQLDSYSINLNSNDRELTKNSNSDSFTKEWMVEKLGALEQRMNGKLQRLNHTLDIEQLEKLFHMVNEEVEINRKKNKERDEIFQQLENKMSQQSKELHHLRKQVIHLDTTIVQLKQLLVGDQLIQPTVPEQGIDNQPDSEEEAVDQESEEITDCETAYDRGSVQMIPTEEHMYTAALQPRGTQLSVKALCKVNKNHAWTVIQRRFDGSVDFFRGWYDYKVGFGDITGEFWLGLENIHHITNQDVYRLRIEMTTFEDEHYWAEYSHFRVSDEADHYRLHVHGYTGNAGDSLTSKWENHNGAPFSTKDNDNDSRFYDSCANDFQGAWWFTSCFDSHLNGIYYQEGAHNNYFQRNGIQWNKIHIHSSLRSVIMMVSKNSDPDFIEPIMTQENGINKIN